MIKRIQHSRILEWAFLRFAVVGGMGLIVDIVVLYLLLAGGAGFYWGRVCSFLTAATATWVINRHWTFEAHQSTYSIWQEWLYYIGLMLFGGVFNYMAYVLCLRWIDWMQDWIFVAVTIGSLAGMGVNFISARYVVFRHRKK